MKTYLGMSRFVSSHIIAITAMRYIWSEMLIVEGGGVNSSGGQHQMVTSLERGPTDVKKDLYCIFSEVTL